ncbi:MAG TPA: trigger factor [Ferruginibacter sp.]|nr:trigger factor [Ferruginibacter sp.]
MATVVRENIGLLHDKLVVKVSKDDYFPSFDKKLKEYSKTANIPGFRKGMVPAGMIKKMYGNSIFTDEILKSVEKELYTYLNAEKPEIFGQPLPLNSDLRNMDINNPADYEFGFEIGIKPDYALPDLSKAKATLHKVKATDTMVDEEIARMQVKAGKMTDLDTISNEDNVINVLFKESDKDGNITEDGITKENSVILKYFTAATQKKFTGKKTGDEVAIQLNKAFEDDKLEAIIQDLGFDKDDKEAPKKYFNLEIVKIGLVEKRELNEEFFKEIYPGKEIKTTDELKASIKEEIENYWMGQSRNQLQDQLYHYLIDETKMEFPEEFLKRWLQTGGEKTKTPEQAEAEFPGFSNQLKWTLISDKLIKDNKLEVGNEELRDYMKTEIMRYFGSMNMGEDTSWIESYIDRMMKDEKQVDSSYRRLITDKLFNWIEGQVKAKEKEVTAEELTAMQHHHEH